MFSKIEFVKNEDYVAQVNHDNHLLKINEDIWDYLNNSEKDFVLWHEAGHLRLDTKSEFLANGYAIQKFANQIEVRNPNDLSQKILFLTNQKLYKHPTSNVITLNVPKENKSNIPPLIIAGIIGAVGSIGGAVIQKSNIGEKARKREAEYYAQLQMAQEQQRQENAKKLIIIGTIAIVVILVVIVLLLKFRKK